MNLPNPHSLFDIRRTDPLAELHDELCYLLDVDDIFVLVGVFCIRILNDLGTSRDL